MNDILNNCAELPERTFQQGEIVIEQGDQTGMLYILAEGCVEIVKENIQIDVVETPGSILGEISVLLDLPHTATVRTLQPCRFLIAERPSEFLEEHPKAHLHLSRVLAKRLNGVTSYLVDLKKQFEDQANHLGMVDEVLECLIHHQPEETESSQ